MSSPAEVATFFADKMTELTGIRTTDYVPDGISPPAGFVRITNITEATYDSYTITLDLVVLVSRASSRAGQKELYEFMDPYGPKSIVVAITALAEPDISVESCTYRGLGVEEMAAYSYDGGAFETVVSISA